MLNYLIKKSKGLYERGPDSKKYKQPAITNAKDRLTTALRRGIYSLLPGVISRFAFRQKKDQQ
jgi:hypothetical protein